MRRIESLMQGWSFATESGEAIPVTLPHTWNNLDGQDGGDDYFRGKCTYAVSFKKPEFNQADEMVYLCFDGVNSSADVIINGQHCTHHDGGYSRFMADVTPYLKDDNSLEVKVCNSVNDRVYPQKADFTFYGGIYRNVTIVVVNKAHFDMSYFGGNGVKITSTIQGENAEVNVKSWHNAKEGTVNVAIKDAHGEIVKTATGENAKLTLQNVHLWQGMKDPYLYTAVLTLVKDNKVVDEVQLRFGVRTFFVDSQKGFFLNGKHYELKGVSRHQDRRGVGNAIGEREHDEDLALIKEMGANSIRLAHYQHDAYFYDRCDEMGFVVWAEIPYISEHMPNGRENTISQMKELIVQNHHHACIMCWGVSNEITISTKDNADMLDNHRVLNDLVHKMDSTRPSVIACYAACLPFDRSAHITDLVGWNLYLGWYVPGLFLNDWWINFFHAVYPKRPLGFSEYGCEGMPNLHSQRPKRNDHTEEYQAKYHEFMLKCFKRHPYMWCNYVWNMFDFAADARNQGGEAGMNHKGLVTFDRKIKKDSFYLYQAYWSEKPMLHIASKRMKERTGKKTIITVYSNQNKVALYLNDVLVEEKTSDKVFKFNVEMALENRIKVVSGSLTDEALILKVDKPNPAYKIKKERKRSNWT